MQLGVSFTDWRARAVLSLGMLLRQLVAAFPSPAPSNGNGEWREEEKRGNIKREGGVRREMRLCDASE